MAKKNVIASVPYDEGELDASTRIEAIKNGFLKHNRVSMHHPTKGYHSINETTFHRKNPMTQGMKAQIARIHSKVKKSKGHGMGY